MKQLYCISVVLLVMLLITCASSKEGCNYPDPSPTYNKEGEIINQN